MSMVSRVFVVVFAMLLTGMNTLRTIEVQAEEAVAVTFTLRSATVTLHEPVFIDFSIHNARQEIVHFDLGHDRKQNFDFFVTTPTGEKVQGRRLIRPDVIGRIGHLALASGATYTQVLFLDEWYRFPALGQYHIVARVTKPIKTHTGITLETRLEQTLTLEVLPRDPQRLEQLAYALAEKVITAEDAGEYIDAANVLRHFNDPVVIPHLQRVLQQARGWRRFPAIDALQGIANAEAVETLISLLTSPDEGIAPGARYALKAIKESSQDLELKRKIDTVLQQEEHQRNP